ncbi:LuxR C-terminal-related transcriptional regulator [Sphingobium sp. Ant17]|uniref:LuxR C-terminal-related transcriptional regulator n=1 Tax=Sphingobium sp. Ant17 TaxID=1461752 RepID=UPI000445404E|nr:response regulator transcription factor [Sphingobium sp. Ant17]EXS71778.1 LuxR family transcriptional regulator [Sphingobium sp. Ant17]OHD01964.1 MAG: LuxR family transcriptional regulator [Sphingomonadales bacterium GWF1_63_6]
MGTILVADDHPLFRQALVMAASNVAPDARILEAATLDRAVETATAASDLLLILLDLKMPGSAGFSGVALLHAERPSVPILVISSADAQIAAAEARRYGAVGFIGKDQDLSVIEDAIAAALAGETPAVTPLMPDEVDDMAGKVASLTPTQLRVLLGVLDGQLNKQIAWELGVAESTIKSHMTTVLAKLGVQNRTQAALAARALGLGNR